MLSKEILMAKIGSVGDFILFFRFILFEKWKAAIVYWQISTKCILQVHWSGAHNSSHLMLEMLEMYQYNIEMEQIKKRFATFLLDQMDSE